MSTRLNIILLFLFCNSLNAQNSLKVLYTSGDVYSKNELLKIGDSLQHKDSLVFSKKTSVLKVCYDKCSKKKVLTGHIQSFNFNDYNLMTQLTGDLGYHFFTPHYSFSPYDVKRLGDEIPFGYINENSSMPIGIVNTLYLDYSKRWYAPNEENYFYLLDAEDKEIRLAGKDGILTIDKALLLSAREEEGNRYFQHKSDKAERHVSVYYKNADATRRSVRSALNLNLIFLDDATDYLRQVIGTNYLEQGERLQLIIDYMILNYERIIISGREYEYLMFH